MAVEIIGFSDTDNDAHPWVGRTIGNLTFTKELGYGRCATVLLAREDPPGRQVAVKALSEEFCAKKEQIQAFVEEARRAGKLRHRNILRIFRVSLYQKRYFMVMEYAAGGTLQDLLKRRRRLPLREAIQIARQTAEGLAFAESRGIVHRDVKPANLLISRDGTIKVADLGVAGQTGEEVIRGDDIYGSPHYMAPEQAMGKPASSQSDIYSLGATLYQMLTGRTPFKDAGRRALILKHMHEEPMPVNRIVPALPKRVSEVISNMMAKKPEERYKSFAQVITELKSLEKIRTLNRLNLSRRHRRER